MRHSLRLLLGTLTLIVGLVVGHEPGAQGSEDATQLAALQALRTEAKFTPNDFYTGADTPEDGIALIVLVNGTIDDILAMPLPLNQKRVRDRLTTLIDRADLFATEDREEAYRYAVRTWRAAGFTGESGLFSASDDIMLARP